MKVCVVGAGPVGLYTAFRLVKEGHAVTLYERSAGIAGNVRSWSFVRLFSKLELNMPQDAKEALREAGRSLPGEDEYQTGAEFVESILEPLAEWLKASGKCEIKTGCEVISLGRGRFLKSDAIMAVGNKKRVGAPFRVLFRAGEREDVQADYDVVVDASGSYDADTANKVGIGGIPAPGEGAAAEAGLLRRVIPDVKGADSGLVAGKRVGEVGTGYSAITLIRNLCDLAQAGGAGAPAEVVWLTRQKAGKAPYSIMEDDPLPQRSELAELGNALVASAGGEGPFGAVRFRYIPGMAVGRVDILGSSMKVTLEVDQGDAFSQEEVDLDVMFSLTGFRPDKELWSELQVHQCYASDGPMKLAATLLAAKVAMEGDPAAAGDCLKQAAPGVETLQNPEPDFYVLGMKSYGRNSTFLMRVGYEQAGLLAEKLKAGA